MTSFARSSRWVMALHAMAVPFGCGDGDATRIPGSYVSTAALAPAPTTVEVAASTPAAPPEPPPPPPVDPRAIAGEAADCPRLRDGHIAFSPHAPNPDAETWAVAMRQSGPHDGLVLIGPDGVATTLAAERRPGPPGSAIAHLPPLPVGSYRVIAHAEGHATLCDTLTVKAHRPAPKFGGNTSVPWRATRRWDRAAEDLYSVWIERLFDSSESESFSFDSLHAITSDPKRNILWNHLDLGEDEPPPKGLRLDPDCADLPYFLRAYFAFKLELPFAYSTCSRGSATKAPFCEAPQHNHEPLETPTSSRVRRFENFLRIKVMNTVHSGTARTLGTDEQTDYYPVALDPRGIRPGTIYADPYGHVLVATRNVPQSGGRAGAIFAVDAQPDGTVAKKRFWRGNFLFIQDEPSMGSPGWKRFRPAIARGESVRLMKNDAILKSADYGDWSTEQMGLSSDEFYDRMDDIQSPRPLDREVLEDEVVKALREQVEARVTSIENGEKYFREGGRLIPMPRGQSIFETTGPWEDFSTPSRDLRLLLAIDVVRGLPGLVARRPERFTTSSATPSAAELEAKLRQKLETIIVHPKNSDGEPYDLTLAQVVDRSAAFERSFNPNNCAELRWGAEPSAPEMRTCRRRAPADQEARTTEISSWFARRKRPPRK